MKKLSLIVLFATVVLLCSLAGYASTPKYIFYFIGDGMGNGHVAAANAYLRTVRNQDAQLLMTQLPVSSLCTTFSASSPVTDSAAAGTALATGTKTLNSMLGMTPDSVALVSVADVLHDNGYGIGIITSVAADDATPGAFYAGQPNRGRYYEIGVEAAESGFEFIGGAGLRGLVDKKGNDTGLRQTFVKNNVSFVRGTDALKSVTTRRVMLLNTDTISNWTLGYTIDSVSTGVKLPEMTQACLDHLEKVAPDKFFMMVEGGNIDHAAHANDGGTVIKEIIKFDEALAIAYDFYKAHPDETLILVTADHATGGMSVGNSYLYYNTDMKHFDSQRISKDIFSDEVKAILKSRRIYTWEDMQEYLREKLGFWTSVPITPEQTEFLHQSFIKTFELRDGHLQKTLYNDYNQFTVDVFNLLQDITGIGWTTNYHVGDPVPVFAVGADANLFGGYLDNTQIPRLILKATGLSGLK